jgi:hypothetical protein
VAVLKFGVGYCPAYHPVATVPQLLGGTGELAITFPAGSSKRNHTGAALLNEATLSHELIVAV